MSGTEEASEIWEGCRACLDRSFRLGAKKRGQAALSSPLIMAEEDNSSDGDKTRVAEDRGVLASTPSSSVDGVPDAEPKPRIRSPKEDEVLDACTRRDIEHLQALALSPGGFVTDELRQQACELCVSLPLAIGISADLRHFPINRNRVTRLKKKKEKKKKSCTDCL